MSASHRNIESIYPLAATQQGMLFHSLYEPESGAYLTQVICRAAIEDVAAFERAWELVVQRHSILRSAMLWENLARPLQAVGRRVSVPIVRLDWRDLGEADRARALTAFLEEDRQRGFKLSKAPLFRLTLQRFGPHDYQVVWTFHHILLDGWSLPIVLSDLLACYEAAVRGELPALLPVRPYADYIAWLQQQDAGRAEAYWRQTLAGITGSLDLGIPVVRRQGGALPQGSARAYLSESDTAALQALAQEQRVTLSTVVHAAWGLVLSQYSGQQDVVFGTTMSGRPAALAGVESMVGLFINVLPARVRVAPDEPLTAMLGRLQQQLVQTADFQFTPLIDIQRWSGRTQGQALFDSIIAFENYPSDRGAAAPSGLQLRLVRSFEKTNYPLTVIATPGRQLAVSVLYDPGTYQPAVAEGVAAHMQNALRWIASHADRPAHELSLLDANERAQVTTGCNATRRSYPSDATLHQLVEAQVERTPDAIAVTFEERHLTYRQLNEAANRLAHHLCLHGVAPDAPVGVCLERSLDLVVALLATLKAGGAYMPLDPDHPADRVRHMVKASGCDVVITEQRFGPVFVGTSARLIELDAQSERLLAHPSSRPATTLSPDHLTYVIYTSGSTGQPKGAMNSHRAICNRLLWMQEQFGLDQTDRVLQKTPFSFDVSVWEFFWPLIVGARLVVARPHGHQDPAYLADAIRDGEITTVHFVPSMLQAFLEQDEYAIAGCRPLRRVFCSGEALSSTLARRCLERIDAELHNLYGPTEAAVDVTHFACERHQEGYGVPIGRPIANTQIYVLDDRMRPVPIGVTGELYIGGVQVGRGYLGRPDLTSERFIPDPYSAEPGARLYRTGDAARYLPDGAVEFIGRLDHQVKIRGNRIELGEIENRVVQHASVTDAVVVAREDSPGDKRLVCYLVGAAPQPTTTELRRFIGEALPEYMVPATFVVLDVLPRLSSGKVDRRALPAPASDRPNLEQTFEAPRTGVEERLAQVWASVLGVDTVGVHDNFFELGGDSILSLQIAWRSKQAGVRLTPRDVFDHPTIAELATVAGSVEPTVAEQGAIAGAIPLTPIARRFFQQRLAVPSHYNQAVLLEVRQPLDEALVRRAVAALVEHHDALRMVARATESGWTQGVLPPGEGKGRFVSVSLAGVPRATQEERIAATAEQLQGALDLSTGPIARFALFDLGPRRPARLLIVIHHLAVDGVSWRVLIDDLERACRQLSEGGSVDLPAKTTSVRQWAETLVRYARSKEARDEASYWLADPGREVSPLPVDRPDGLAYNTSGWTRSVELSLSVRETKALLQQAPKAYGCDVTDVLLTAAAQAIGRWAGSDAVLFELEGHGREPIADALDLSRTVGWFTTAFPVSLDTGLELEPGDALRAVKEQIRAIPRKGIGYGVLRYLAGDADFGARLAARPQPQVAFNYLGRLESASHGNLLSPVEGRIGRASSPSNARAHLLEINALVTRGRLRVEWRYGERIHEAQTIEAVAGEFLETVRRLVAHCASRRVRAYTPSDFPLAHVGQRALDVLQAHYGRDGLEDLYAPSPMQQGMLYHSLANPGSAVFVTQISCGLAGPLNRPAFREAWQQVVDAHPVLRAAFALSTDEIQQVVCRRVRVPWREEDLRRRTPAERQQRIDEYLELDRQQLFDLAQPPLLRVALFRLDRDSYQLVLTLHHSVVDGWSLPLIFDDVFAAYDAMCQGRALRIEPRRPFRDYIAWLRRRDASADEAYWRETLSGFTSPTPLPVRPHATAGRDEGPGYGTLSGRIPAAVTSAIQQFAREHDLTLNTVMQGAWAALLARHAGETDVVYGTTLSGRPAEIAGVDKMIGVFINTLPMRVRVEGAVATWLQRLQTAQLQLRDHEYTPLIDAQRWSDVRGGLPLFESLFVFENYPVPSMGAAPSLDAVRLTDVRGFERVNYPLTFVSRPGAEISCQIIYDRQRFDDETIARLMARTRVLLEAMTARPDAQVAALAMLTEDEATQQLVEWNDTGVEVDLTQSVTDIVETVAARHPDAVAVTGADERWTYAMLNRRANALAAALRERGVRRGDVVAVLTARSCGMIAAFLAVVKAGAAYLPIDPETPAERMALMIDDAGVAAVLAQDALVSLLPREGTPSTLVSIDAGLDGPGVANPPRHTTPDDLAYIIYTSGSTGRPKGVAVTHRGLTNLVAWHQRAFAITSSDRATQLASQGFDAAVWEIWPYLAAGASVHLADRDTRIDADRLRAWLHEHRITIGFVATEVAERLMDAEDTWPADSALRVLLTGADTLRRFPAASLPFVVVNNYGPTECSVVATSGLVPAGPASGGLPSIGRPIDNVTTYVLDGGLNLVPAGSAGELYIGGLGIARGYYRRAALTAERFVPDPFGGVPGARLYRTGDRVRFTPDGQLEFLGRLDHQVKVRGFRIELGEVEAVIRRHPAVAEGIVLARAESGVTRLVAYVIQRGAGVTVSELIGFLRQTLPAYMVPEAFVALDAFPLTRNGKIDTTALPLPGDTRPALQSAFVAPRSTSEEMVASVWSDLLGVATVGVHDNFFDLGGHSLLATRLMSRLRDAFSVDLPLRDLFETPTVAAIAERIAERRSGGRLDRGRIAPVSRDAGMLPLSLSQRRLWFLSRFAARQYHVSAALRILGRLDTAALDRGMRTVVQRHESLRTVFPTVDGTPVQRVVPADAFACETLDFSALPPAAREDACARALVDGRERSFDLESGPLFRATLIRLDDETHVLALAMHHIIADAWSIGIIWRELSALYAAFAGGHASPLAEPELQYADFAAWQHDLVHGPAMASQLSFWRTQLAGAATLQLPTDRPRPPVQTFNGAKATASCVRQNESCDAMAGPCTRSCCQAAKSA
ncbi:MAG: amino acid adenylation domain-containing protein, partial [Vicinamibacterales bacterium]